MKNIIKRLSGMVTRFAPLFGKFTRYYAATSERCRAFATVCKRVYKKVNGRYWHKYVFEFLTYFFQKYKKDRISSLAQSLAYTSSLSVIPLFIIFFSILGYFSKDADVQGKINGFFSRFMIPESVSGIFLQLEKISADAVKLGVVGFPTLFFIGVMMYMKMDGTINIIWRTTIRRRLQNNISSFVMSVFFGPVLLILVSSLPAYLQAVPYVRDIISSPVVVLLVENVLPFLIGSFIFYLLYMYLPVTNVRWWAAMVGGGTASLMVWLNNFILGLYIGNFTNYDIVYGSISILPIFLLWVWFLWMAILLGASMAYCAQHFTIGHGGSLAERNYSEQSLLNKVLVVFFLLTHRFQKKNGAPSAKELETALEIPLSELHIILDKLANENLIVKFDSLNNHGKPEKRYQPAISPSKIKLSHLRKIFHRSIRSGFTNVHLTELLDRVQLHPAFDRDISIQDIYEKPNEFIQFMNPQQNARHA